MLFGLGAPALAAVPRGFTVESSEQLIQGVVHNVLVRESPPLRVHVARIGPNAPVSLRAVPSHGTIAGGKERTSAACRRVGCIVAVNGDFWVPGDEVPLGGVATLGEMLRSPNRAHHQLVISPQGDLDAVNLKWGARIVSTDLHTIGIDGLNRPRGPNQAVLYTPAFGSTTQTNKHGVEIVAELVEPLGPVRLGQTSRLKLLKLIDSEGSAPLREGTVVLSGHGKGERALKSLWSRVGSGAAGEHVLLRVETTTPTAETVGGTPILLKDGRRWFQPESSSFYTGRHPRTIVGWNPEGFVWLVTVDGRQPGYSTGMTLSGAAELMLELGATDAINLDGGGSTTFVVAGSVSNRPSDRVVDRSGSSRIVPFPTSGDRVIGNVERPVAVVLALVPRVPVNFTPGSDPLADGVGLPLAAALGDPSEVDPGSNPHSDLPALVLRQPKATGSLVLAALVLNLGATVVIAVALGVPRRRSA